MMDAWPAASPDDVIPQQEDSKQSGGTCARSNTEWWSHLEHPIKEVMLVNVPGKGTTGNGMSREQSVQRRRIYGLKKIEIYGSKDNTTTRDIQTSDSEAPGMGQLKERGTRMEKRPFQPLLQRDSDSREGH